MTLKECQRALLSAAISLHGYGDSLPWPCGSKEAHGIAEMFGYDGDGDALHFLVAEAAKLDEAPEPAHEVKRLTPIEAKIAEVAGRIKARHPACRSCGIAEITKKLKAILAWRKREKHPSMGTHGKIGLVDLIDENHAGWCASSQWQRMGPDGPGHFARGLANWLAPTEERYLEPPPVVQPTNGIGAAVHAGIAMSRATEALRGK